MGVYLRRGVVMIVVMLLFRLGSKISVGNWFVIHCGRRGAFRKGATAT